jgi:hypothetical protein
MPKKPPSKRDTLSRRNKLTSLDPYVKVGRFSRSSDAGPEGHRAE